MLAEGAIWPVVAARFPVERVVDAHAELENGNPKGAVVVCVAQAKENAGRVDPRAA